MTTETEKHTAGPVTVEGTVIRGEQGILIGAAEFAHVEVEVARANAARLALCWNTHDDLTNTLSDCQEIMDAAANQISEDGYIDPAEFQATARQLAEYAMKARAAIAKATP